MFRQTPSSLYLCGAPNIGKSHLIIHIVKRLNEKIYKFPNYRSIVFARTVTTEHWDGYHGQPIVVFDDHYKMFDGEQLVDAQEVMNVVSCTNYYPSFAVLHQKGVPFNSNFLIITSNCGFPITMYLPSALHRRHKIHVLVIPNGKERCFDFSHLNFYYSIAPVDLWRGNYSQPFSSFHDIPYNLSEFNIFPFKNLYKFVSLSELIDLLIEDFNNEKYIFNSLV